MKRTIKAYGSYYKDFFDTLDKSTKEKILYGMKKKEKEEMFDVDAQLDAFFGYFPFYLA